MARTTTEPSEKISKAMSLVNQARQQKIEKTQKNLKQKLSETKDYVEEAKEQANEKLDNNVKLAREKISNNPINYILGATIIGLIIGLLFGRKNK